MLGFGDYVETYDPKVRSNTMRERTEPCVALYPAANVSGSWIFWNLKTEAYVRRTHWVKMFTPHSVIAVMNQHAGERVTVKADVLPKQEDERAVVLETVVPRSEPDVPTMTVEEAEIENTAKEEKVEVADEAHGGEYDEDVKPQLMATEPEPEPAQIRRSERSRVEKRDSNFEYTLTQMSVRKGLEKHGAAAKEAIRTEFEQLFKKKRVFKPVRRSRLDNKKLRKVIRSSMFLKEKYDGLGKFEKLKGRLVADGRMQDKSIYGDKISPTAKIDSIMMELSIAVEKGRRIAKVDIGGAYLNAYVDEGDEIHMELSRELTKVLLELFPELREFVDDKSGKLIVQILKALYGLVQSAALWYSALTTFLKSLGFVANKIDNCVMNMRKGGRNMTIVLYVDDILILSESDNDIKRRVG
jgi:Reverse transcriptase (RNA-dependent DNA polymerase).